LAPGDEVVLPDAPYVHLFVARGQVDFDQAELGEGDAVRLTASGGVRVAARAPAEILVWEMHAGLGD
jgi:quercetin 2,3-dioxygenase